MKAAMEIYSLVNKKSKRPLIHLRFIKILVDFDREEIFASTSITNRDEIRLNEKKKKNVKFILAETNHDETIIIILPRMHFNALYINYYTQKKIQKLTLENHIFKDTLYKLL